MVAITYQLPPRPPTVAFVRQADLPDWKWRNEHPGETQVPAQVMQQGRDARMRILQQQAQRSS